MYKHILCIPKQNRTLIRYYPTNINPQLNVIACGEVGRSVGGNETPLFGGKEEKPIFKNTHFYFIGLRKCRKARSWNEK